MASFCVQCGSPLNGAFCVKCGADARATTNPDQDQTSIPSAQQIRAALGSPAIAKKGLSPLAKLGIAAVVIIFVGGVAGGIGVYYVAHRVSQKIHQLSDGALGSQSDSGNSSNASSSTSGDNSLGDVCRFLSKEDVSKAIGIEIVRTQFEDNGCSYIAKGTQVDLMAKHAAAMAGDMGAEKSAQQFAQAYAGIIGKTSQTEKPTAEQASGEGPVFGFSLDQNAAEEQMRLNAAVLGNLGPKQGLDSIGDQAFVTGDGIMLVRKGKTLVRIMYLTCPCGVKQVIPLAKKLADSL